MSIQDLSMLFGLCGGVGMFLYGMHVMGEGLQKSAGDKMSHLLEILTTNPLMGVMVGALVTGIIQSSGATTVMVVGFVNAGIMSLSQAVGVIMGANIGTTVTAWIVSMSQFSGALELFNPSFWAPLILGVGAFIMLFAQKDTKKAVGEILVGLGLLFTGLDLMSGSIAPYTDLPIFATAFTALGNNPILGALVGFVVTALLQSSSASVGILQSLAMQGVVTTNAAIYITLGQNIGSCVTALISSAGANKNAKRAAVIHLSFNIIGSLVFGSLFFVYFTFINRTLAASAISAVQISIFHTFFNSINTAVLLPFRGKLVKLSQWVIRDSAEPGETQEFPEIHLDSRLLESPAVAVSSVTNEVIQMGNMVIDNMKEAVECIRTRDSKALELVHRRENRLDEVNDILTDYLVKVSQLPLTEQQNQTVNNLFYTINDLERIGDHSDNIAEITEYMMRQNLYFSDEALNQIMEVGSVIIESVEAAVNARKNMSMEDVRVVSKNEDQVDMMEEDLREEHIERLTKNLCTPPAGVSFLDFLTNFERVSDHAYNIAGYVKDEL